jgi:hypothetical protein
MLEIFSQNFVTFTKKQNKSQHYMVFQTNVFVRSVQIAQNSDHNIDPRRKQMRIFLLRNAPAGNHQLVAEDLMEDGTISQISNAY